MHAVPLLLHCTFSSSLFQLMLVATASTECWTWDWASVSITLYIKQHLSLRSPHSFHSQISHGTEARRYQVVSLLSPLLPPCKPEQCYYSALPNKDI